MKKRFKKSIILFSAIFVFSFFLPSAKVYGFWTMEMEAAMMKIGWETAWTTFREAMTVALKKQASKLLSDRIESLLTGNSRRTLIITDYEDYVFGTAQRQGLLFTNYFFRSATSGVSASTRKYLKATERAIRNDAGSLMPDIDQRVQGGLENLFDTKRGGGNALAAIERDMNNPFGAWLTANSLKEREEAKIERIQEMKALAGRGFDSGTNASKNSSYNYSAGDEYSAFYEGGSSELINLPGSIVADITAEINLMPMRMVESADNFQAVVGNLAAQVISKAIEKGIADVTQPIDETLAGINRSVSGGIDEIRRDIYQGIKFSGSSGN